MLIYQVMLEMPHWFVQPRPSPLSLSLTAHSSNSQNPRLMYIINRINVQNVTKLQLLQQIKRPKPTSRFPSLPACNSIYLLLSHHLTSPPHPFTRTNPRSNRCDTGDNPSRQCQFQQYRPNSLRQSLLRWHKSLYTF